jgi:hypothetical protein
MRGLAARRQEQHHRCEAERGESGADVGNGLGVEQPGERIDGEQDGIRRQPPARSLSRRHRGQAEPARPTPRQDGGVDNADHPRRRAQQGANRRQARQRTRQRDQGLEPLGPYQQPVGKAAAVACVIIGEEA